MKKLIITLFLLIFTITYSSYSNENKEEVAFATTASFALPELFNIGLSLLYEQSEIGLCIRALPIDHI